MIPPGMMMINLNADELVDSAVHTLSLRGLSLSVSLSLHGTYDLDGG